MITKSFPLFSIHSVQPHYCVYHQNNKELKMNKKYQQQKQQFNSLIRRGLYSRGRPEFLIQIGQLCVYCVFDLCPDAFQTFCGLSRAKVKENIFRPVHFFPTKFIFAGTRFIFAGSGSLREPSEPTRQTGFRQIWLLAARPNRLA